MSKWYLYNKKNNYINNLRVKNITKLQAKILGNREIIDPNLVEMYINPNLNNLHDPFLLPDIKEAIDILIKCMENGQKIRIFGDYDQDGIASVMTLMDGLLYFYDDVSFDIPDRVKDGYGLSKQMAEKAIEDKISLVITCDNGITSFENINLLKNAGIKVIVTDHHQVEKEDVDGWIKQKLPDADCVINPKRLDSKYPFDDLCGAGVSFKLMEALYKKLGGDNDYFYGLLEYVVMGMVRDIVSLTDDNRIFVIEGLKRINSTDKFAIKALLEKNKWDREVTAYTLGFIIGPCMNASGRLDSAKIAIDMLMEDDIDKIYEYSEYLVSLNQERKKLTEDGFEKAVNVIEENKYFNDDIIIVYEKDIQESICGIVAGRIKEKYHKPTIVLSNSSKDCILKGSGRSIEAYNMYKEVFAYSKNLESFGGHPMACGLSIKQEKLEEFRRFLNKESELSKDDFERNINIDMEVNISKLSLEFAESLNKFEPFGKDNPRPVFADRKVKIKKLDLLGKNKNTLKLILEKDSRMITAIKFNADEDYQYLNKKFNSQIKDQFIDIVYYPDVNEYNGNRNLQIKLLDIR